MFFWLTTYYRHGHNLVLLKLTLKQLVVYLLSTLGHVDVGNFSVRRSPAKDLGDTATAKDSFNQVMGDYFKATPWKLHLSVARGNRCRENIAEFLFKT